jgi:1-aminocyclopropane-1-carboxylate deaminase/D-cysteine desulfhydrase-like pyridoxal-dependent ACC family enzyme
MMGDRIAPTPLRFYPRLSEELGISLWVKHDDLFPLAAGGNKARKLQRILAEGISGGCDALVTTGSFHSNHVRAASLMAARLGWHARLVIHDTPRDKLEGNLLLAALAGAEITFCQREQVGAAMDQAMDDLSKRGRKPLYILGGGHCRAGGLAYCEAAQELAGQYGELANLPDYIFVASGTGTTQAGLHAGCAEYLPSTKVIGISVAHGRERGMENVAKSIDDLSQATRLVIPKHEISFYDGFLSGGYGLHDEELLELIRWAAGLEALLLDPFYTGKAFRGLRDHVRSGRVAPGSTVCFWHTGGIFNLLNSEFPGSAVTSPK